MVAKAEAQGRAISQVDIEVEKYPGEKLLEYNREFIRRSRKQK